MGNYIDNNLIKDERVEFETKYHWIIFLDLSSILTLFIIPLIAMKTDEFAITNKRVMIKTGLISRRTFEMNINKIETVGVHQTIMGRILGYGSVKIIGTGGTSGVFHRISNPLEFRKKFQELTL